LSNLLQRVLSALVLLPVIIFLLVLGGWYTRGLILVVTAIAMWEYGRIVVRQDLLLRGLLIVCGPVCVGVAFLTDDAGRALLTLQASLIVFAAATVLKPGDLPTAWRRMATAWFGIAYAGFGLWSLGRLRELGGEESGAAPAAWVFLALLATWSGDTLAYFAGRAFGKHKMAELISPKKTWEGFAGGAVGTVAMLFLCRYVLFPSTFQALVPLDLIFIALPTAFLGPMGDLAESLLKRNYEVKDSSNIIPGHGGMLDRIDALFFVGPWVLLYLTTIKPFLAG
jgi:phosphatidate cytidylyltransferase